MNNHSLVNDKLQEEGQELLNQTNLIEMLKRYGDVRIGGSFVYGTMVDRDIDITVTLESSNEVTTQLCSKLCAELTALEGCVGLKMADRKLDPKPGRPLGLWLSPQFILKDRWYLDIWVINGEDSALLLNANLDEAMRKISEKQRKLILEIKTEVLHRGLKNKGVSSVQIYEDVLSGKVQSANEWIAIVEE